MITGPTVAKAARNREVGRKVAKAQERFMRNTRHLSAPVSSVALGLAAVEALIRWGEYSARRARTDAAAAEPTPTKGRPA